MVILFFLAVVVVNELRSEAVHSRFTSLFEQYFTIKRTPRSKMDAVHQHSAIDILILRRRKAADRGGAAATELGVHTAAEKQPNGP